LTVIFSIALLAAGVCDIARAAEGDPFPSNKAAAYEYSQDDIPETCFFPAGKARWDGNKVMAADWFKLTDYQKAMFISEYVGELEKQYGHPVKIDGWEYLGLMNQGIAAACGEDPESCANAKATVTFDAVLLAKGMRELMPPDNASAPHPSKSA